MTIGSRFEMEVIHIGGQRLIKIQTAILLTIIPFFSAASFRFAP